MTADLAPESLGQGLQADLRYTHLNGTSWSWPAGDAWQAEHVADFDLVVLRTALRRALAKVDREATKRGLG